MINKFFCLVGILLFFNTLFAEIQSTREFLHESKKKYQNIINSDRLPFDKIHFVLGNESADMDSVVSSIVYAFLLHQENLSNPEQLYIPLLNIRREEIALRRDILHLFNLLQISLEDLLFLDDDIPLDFLFSKDKLRLNLVDHNVLRHKQEHLSSSIERIVDHHFDENKHYSLLLEENKLIAVVASTATLISEKFLSSQHISITPDISLLLLAPILLDTANLQSEKTTVRDIEAIETLRAVAKDILPYDFYEILLSSKQDISELTPYMILSKDFKEYLDRKFLYGISTIPVNICWGNEYIPEISPILEKFTSERDLDFLFLLMNNTEPTEPKRKILVYSSYPELLNAFQLYVQADETLRDVLLPLSASYNDRICFYGANKFTARKQLQPLFHFSQIFIFLK